MSNAEMYMLFAKQSKKTVDIKRLTARLDKYFSEYVRRRDADNNGMCRCITCGRMFHWKELDAGHYIQRDRKATRYDERNVNAQCIFENRFRSGEQYLHGKAIDKKFGKGTADLLQTLSKVSYTKLDTGWFLYHIDLYKKKIKELKCKSNV